MNLELPKAVVSVPGRSADRLQGTSPMKPKSDLVVGLTVVALAITGLAWLIPAGITLPGSERSVLLSPAFWPKVLFWLLLAMGLTIILGALRSGRAAKSQNTDGLLPLTRISLLKGLVFIGGLFVYYWVIHWIGIVLASTLMLIGAMCLGGQKQWLPMLLTAVLLPLAAYLFFVHVAKIPMPLGIFEQWL
ncbi:tripartite tricarboxylate transporter TctB family protein [Marinobacterium aestuariivivens]|uniref:Tripartite tricarboxylate transporter TctB family protein n=1 Tax=Marinobacterium aestuariivivens TaxID=1698799 RepID=A0ABW2A5T9_9GAMM